MDQDTSQFISSLKPNNEQYKKEMTAKQQPGLQPIPENQQRKQVTTGKVVVKNKSLASKFVGTFIENDIQTVKEWIVTDVIIPGLKNAISDILIGAVEMTFGGGRSDRRSHGSRDIYSYNRVSSNKKSDRDSRSRRDGREEDCDYRDIILESRGEAESVIDAMLDDIERYESVSVGALYEFIGKSSNASFQDYKWGWTNLRDASVRRVRDGYKLDLPKPEPIN